MSDKSSSVFDGDAHALLCSIYRDPAQPIELRLEAARAAVRYEKPLQPEVKVIGETGGLTRPELTAAECIADLTGQKSRPVH